MKYKQLSQEQRYTIAQLLKQNATITFIAATIGVHKSTVSREIKETTPSVAIVLAMPKCIPTSARNGGTINVIYPRRRKHLIKPISTLRSTIERTFGSIRIWFHGGRCRYRVLDKTHTQNVMESIAFNLYRTHEIIMSNCFG